MFTGLIEAVGDVVELSSGAATSRLRIRTDLAPELAVGDSLAVNGVCLTVTLAKGGEVCADLGPETLRITSLGRLGAGQPVNLERPLRADGRFGGHFVQGHVDGMGEVQSVRVEGDVRWVTIRFPQALAPYLVQKGSVAVDGVSLTVAELDGSCFTLMVIPHTLGLTNLGGVGPGDTVNLECDMIGKYVARALDLLGPGSHDGMRTPP